MGGDLEVLFVEPIHQIVDQIPRGVEILFKLLFDMMSFWGNPDTIGFRVKPK
jgi:hypothetical protein